jgi:glucose dehydrogenase
VQVEACAKVMFMQQRFFYMMTRYLVALVCIGFFVAGCGSSYDGEKLWQFETKKTHRQWAAVDEQRMYLCADDVYCLDIESGRVLWEFETFGTHSSAPVIEEGRLFFQCGGLYALDAATGDVLWEFWTTNWAAISPAVDAGHVYASIGEQLYCLDAASGKRMWAVTTGVLRDAPVVQGARLFYCSDGTIVCLGTSSGKELWSFDAASDRVQLASAGDYVLSVGSSGILRAHDISTGKVQWQFDTTAPVLRMRVSPAGHVLVFTGELYCVNSISGDLLWKFGRDQVFVFDAQILGTYAFVRGSRLGLFCILMNDGSFMWRLNFPDGGILLKEAGGTIFLPSNKSRNVTCLTVPEI